MAGSRGRGPAAPASGARGGQGGPDDDQSEAGGADVGAGLGDEARVGHDPEHRGRAARGDRDGRRRTAAGGGGAAAGGGAAEDAGGGARGAEHARDGADRGASGPALAGGGVGLE